MRQMWYTARGGTSRPLFAGGADPGMVAGDSRMLLDERQMVSVADHSQSASARMVSADRLRCLST